MLGTHLTRKHVLFIDDEKLSTKYFKKSFDERCAVICANDVGEASKILEERASEIGVIVSDQRMPGGSGLEFLERCRRQHPRIVRILLTAYTDHEAMLTAVNTGAVYRYLIKPYDPVDLGLTLERALEFHLVQEERDELMRERVAVTHHTLLTERLADMGALALGMGHHLRNALVPVQSYLELLSQNHGSSQPGAGGQDATLATLERAAKRRLDGVVAQIEELERWGQRRESPKRIQVSVLEILKCIPGEEVRLHPDQEDLVLLADPEQMKQAFRILFEDNASLLSKKGRIRMAQVRRSRDPEGVHTVRIKVPIHRDWWKAGGSILELFDPFRINLQAPSERTPHLLNFFFLVDHQGGELRFDPRSEEDGVDLIVDFPKDGAAEHPPRDGAALLSRFKELELAWESHLIGT